MTPKTRTLTATVLFVIFAVVFYLPIPVPHKLVFPVAILFAFSIGLTAWHRFVEPVPYRHYLVLVSYFLAQWLLFVRSTPYRIASLRPFRF